jgi:hypothetical protein
MLFVSSPDLRYWNGTIAHATENTCSYLYGSLHGMKGGDRKNNKDEVT